MFFFIIMVQLMYRLFKLAPFCKQKCRESLLSTSWVHIQSLPASTYVPSYTHEEQTRILQKINESAEEELSRYAISKTRAKNIHRFKHKNGNFKSLDQILQVDNLGVKVLDKLCSSILKGTTKNESEAKEKNKTKSNKQLVTPFVEKSQLQEVDSIVGIHIFVDALAFAELNCKAELLSWEVHHLDFKKLHITALFEFAQKVISFLPVAEIYVMEDRQHTCSPSQQQSLISRQNMIFTAMLVSLLNVSKATEQERKLFRRHHVFFLRSLLPARLFQLIVGKERISAEALVNEILQGTAASDNSNTLGYTPISVDSALKKKYLQGTSADREHYSHALLLTMTFLDLILYENPNFKIS